MICTGDKFGAHEEIKARKADHDDDERKRTVNRVLLQDEAERAEDGESREYEENEEDGRHECPHFSTANAVTMTLAMETGRSSFQPTFMSWS